MKAFNILRLEVTDKTVTVYLDGTLYCQFFYEGSKAQLERLLLQRILDSLLEYTASELKEAEPK